MGPAERQRNKGGGGSGRGESRAPSGSGQKKVADQSDSADLALRLKIANMERFAARAAAILPAEGLQALQAGLLDLERGACGAVEFMMRVRGLVGVAEDSAEMLGLLDGVLPPKFALLEEFEVRGESDRIVAEVDALLASTRQPGELLRSLGAGEVRSRARRMDALRGARAALERAEAALGLLGCRGTGCGDIAATVLRPCAHVVLCAACAARAGRCPVCSAAVTGWERARVPGLEGGGRAHGAATSGPQYP